MPSFALEPCDEKFFQTAPIIHSFAIDLPVPTEVAWAELTGPQALSWCTGVKKVEFTSPKPYAVGTTRTVSLSIGVVSHEKYFRWEEGRRNTFYMETSSAPGLRRFGEDTLVEPIAGGSRLTWSFAIELKGPTFAHSLVSPVIKPVLKAMINDTKKHFNKLSV
ncbi:MAG: SRPBCC family protein [Mycobacteriaceae bacterium]